MKHTLRFSAGGFMVKDVGFAVQSAFRERGGFMV